MTPLARAAEGARNETEMAVNGMAILECRKWQSSILGARPSQRWPAYRARARMAVDAVTVSLPLRCAHPFLSSCSRSPVCLCTENMRDEMLITIKVCAVRVVLVRHRLLRRRRIGHRIPR